MADITAGSSSINVALGNVSIHVDNERVITRAELQTTPASEHYCKTRVCMIASSIITHVSAILTGIGGYGIAGYYLH